MAQMPSPSAALQRRLDLDELLNTLMPSEGNVYFQPKENIRLSYPAIVYSRDDTDDRYADNILYSHTQRYQVTLMDSDPDSDILEKLKQLPMCKFVRHFTTAGLNHDIFNLYY